ncbi:MAG: hypothetical protein KDH96_11780, partial [Candidatus Riesia sp.]|nr:hypothetical protein [Candidatus Riesia sp.]
KIPDSNFLTPDQINQHPCLTSDRWLNAVPAGVTISQVCQDPYNTSLVILTITLTGSFLFSPSLRILSVDGDTSFQDQGIQASFALGHYKNPALPINTNCSTWYGTLVFDVGTKIANFLRSQTIEFELIMDGQIPQAYGVDYPNESASYVYLWNKGVLPSPVGLTYTDGVLGVTFEYLGDVSCTCDLTCSTASGVTHTLSFCPDDKQTIRLYQDTASQDPYSILVQLQDAVGNLSELSIQSVFGTKPKKPDVVKKIQPKRLEVNVTKISANGIELDDSVQYQVLKFEGTSSNISIWKDWSNHSWNHFIDYDILDNKTYGYAVRFKGQFGDESIQSDWTIITT